MELPYKNTLNPKSLTHWRWNHMTSCGVLLFKPLHGTGEATENVRTVLALFYNCWQLSLCPTLRSGYIYNMINRFCWCCPLSKKQWLRVNSCSLDSLNTNCFSGSHVVLMHTWTIGLPKYFLVKSDKLQSKTWAKKWRDSNFESHPGIIYHEVGRFSQLWSSSNVVISIICPNVAQNWSGPIGPQISLCRLSLLSKNIWAALMNKTSLKYSFQISSSNLWIWRYR